MGNPIEDPRRDIAEPRPRFDPYTGRPISSEDLQDDHPLKSQGQHFKEDAEPFAVSGAGGGGGSGQAFGPRIAQGSDGGASPYEGASTNPYAPTGWRMKHRNEFDITLPSGQLARIARLEREDLFRMNLMGYLDTFTPMLMEETISSDERNRRIRDRMNNDSSAVTNMFMAIDEVVMAAAVRPRVTDKQDQADYGSPKDWSNPNFVATAYINDIEMDDRFAIFAAAFGRSMDDLKSIREQTAGMASVADMPSVQQNS